VQIPDDVARELVEEFIRAPEQVEKRMREAPPTLQRTLAPTVNSRHARPRGGERGSPLPQEETRAAANGEVNGDGRASAGAASEARGKRSAKKPRRARTASGRSRSR